MQGYVLQELILTKYTAKFGACLKSRFDEKLKINELTWKNKELANDAYAQWMTHVHEDSRVRDDKGAQELICRKQALMESKLYCKQFDFYGQDIRLLSL